MRKFILLIFIFSIFSCEKNPTNDILPTVDVNVVIDLNLPEYINLQTPSNWVYANGGLKGIFIQNTGTGNPKFKAFERACPNNDCSAPMTFDGSLKLKCSCDESEYSIIDGAPQTSGNNHFAREYKVNQINESTLIITNY
ncbi:MAG: phosphoribosylaminoimidazole carboxylase [Lutibacter sp.]